MELNSKDDLLNKFIEFEERLTRTEQRQTSDVNAQDEGSSQPNDDNSKVDENTSDKQQPSDDNGNSNATDDNLKDGQSSSSSIEQLDEIQKMFDF